MVKMTSQHIGLALRTWNLASTLMKSLYVILGTCRSVVSHSPGLERQPTLPSQVGNSYLEYISSSRTSGLGKYLTVLAAVFGVL